MRRYERGEVTPRSVVGGRVAQLDHVDFAFELAHNLVVDFVLVVQLKNGGALHGLKLHHEIAEMLVFFAAIAGLIAGVVVEQVEPAMLRLNQFVINVCEFRLIVVAAAVRDRRRPLRS